MGYYWISTTKNQYWQEKKSAMNTSNQPNLIITDETKREINGFGGCFNELGIEALSQVQAYKEEGITITFRIL